MPTSDSPDCSPVIAMLVISDSGAPGRNVTKRFVVVNPNARGVTGG